MEFRLNKIDTDIRKEIKESTKTDKIHPGNDSSLIKELKSEEQKDENCKKQKRKKEEKKYITIEGVRYNEKKVDIEVEKIEIIDANNIGRILDKKK